MADTFEKILRYVDPAIGGTARVGGGGTPAGDLDSRYLQEANNLSDLADPETAQANMGLHDATADLDLSSISIDGVNLFPGLDPQALGVSDSPTWAGGTFTGQVHIDPSSLNNVSFVIDRYNASAGIFRVGEHDAIGSAGSFGGALVHSQNRAFAVTTANTGFGLLASSDIALFVGGNSNQVAINATSFVGTEVLRAVGATRLEGDVTATGTLTGVDATFSDDVAVSGALTVTLDATFQDDVFVQGGLFTREHIVDVTRVQFDNAMAPGGGMVVTVTGTAGSETITFEDEDGNNIVPLAADDIIHIQQRTGLTTGTVVKNIWRKVASITGSDITLTDTGITWTAGTANDDTGSIEVGDHVVVKGNTTDATRDHYIKFQISGIDVPTIFGFDSVTDVNDGGTKKYVIGDMSEAPTLSNGTVPSGVGFFSDNAFLEGTIISTSGEIGGWTLASAKLTGGDVAGEFTGMQSGAGTTLAFFAGADDDAGTNALFYARADGKIFHDAVGGIVQGFSSQASFGKNPTNASLPSDSNNWSVDAPQVLVGTNTNSRNVKHYIIRKRFGADTLILKGRAKREITSAGVSANTNHTGRIILNAVADASTDVSDTHIITTSSFDDFLIEMDISGISTDDRIRVTIEVEAETEVIDNPDSNTANTEAFLSENLSVEQRT